MPINRTIPPIYLPPEHPDYRPAWQAGTLVDCCMVLEGGAMRGQFSAGVLDYLMDEGILPDKVVGVSAGALNGFNFRAGARGRSSYLNIKYCKDWRYFSMRCFALTGSAFNAKFVFHKIPDKLDPLDFAAYDSSPITLFTVASDLQLGEASYHQLRKARSERDWLRASASLPILSRIVEVDGLKLLDGGICDSVPMDFAASLNSKKTLVVLTRDRDYLKPPYRGQALALARRLYRDYPWFLERMAHRSYEYNRMYRRIARMAASGEIFVLRPPAPVEIASMEHDPDKLYQLYLTGYAEAKRRGQELARYLG
ncbi:MAG: patatin family protein [Coriobacteriales bacterium]|jgi:predicted patatin/cPLA2 family phospholipase|nr:patatin family protein [Coriobacteriales bacterium]